MLHTIGSDFFVCLSKTLSLLFSTGVYCGKSEMEMRFIVIKIMCWLVIACFLCIIVIWWYICIVLPKQMWISYRFYFIFCTKNKLTQRRTLVQRFSIALSLSLSRSDLSIMKIASISILLKYNCASTYCWCILSNIFAFWPHISIGLVEKMCVFPIDRNFFLNLFSHLNQYEWYWCYSISYRQHYACIIINFNSI